MSSDEIPSSSASGAGLMLTGCSLLGQRRRLRGRSRSLVCHGRCAPQPRGQPTPYLQRPVSRSHALELKPQTLDAGM